MVDFALSRFSNRMSRRMMPRGGEVLWDLQLVWCWLSVSFQLVKEFDVIHTPNQVGDLCSLCLPQSGQLPSRPACPPALCFSTCRCVGWMQKALLLFLNSSLWHGQFCSVCLTCRCCCSSYWNGFTFHFLLNTSRCLQELPQFLSGDAFYSFSPPHFSCRKWRLLQSPFFLDFIAVLFRHSGELLGEKILCEDWRGFLLMCLT